MQHTVTVNPTQVETTTRATAPQILAHLIALGQRQGLPDPRAMDANASNSISTVDLCSVEGVRAWAGALDAAEKVTSHRMSEHAGHLAGQWLHSCHLQDVRGWTVHLSAVTPADDDPKPIEPETVAVLEQLAPPFAKAEHREVGEPQTRDHRGEPYYQVSCACGTSCLSTVSIERARQNLANHTATGNGQPVGAL